MPTPRFSISGLDSQVIERLKKRAKQHGRSVAAELRVIVRDATHTVDAKEAQKASIAAVQKHFAGRHFSDSTELIREDRER